MIPQQKLLPQLLHLAILFRLFQERLKPVETTKKGTARDNAPEFSRIHCPLCKWRPKASSHWYCGDCDYPEYFFGGCGTAWNTFTTGGLSMTGLSEKVKRFWEQIAELRRLKCLWKQSWRPRNIASSLNGTAEKRGLVTLTTANLAILDTSVYVDNLRSGRLNRKSWISNSLFAAVLWFWQNCREALDPEK